jgi:hypothetical protein
MVTVQSSKLQCPVNRLNAALLRLNAALVALETGLTGRPGNGAETSSEEVAELKAECSRLASRVASLEEDARYLAGLSEEVENRLDGAISEIRDTLGRN